jgi:hypothetical protein
VTSVELGLYFKILYPLSVAGVIYNYLQVLLSQNYLLKWTDGWLDGLTVGWMD